MAQQIIKGLENLKPFLEGKRVFLVHGHLDRFPFAKALLEGYAAASFSDITPNPLYEQVALGVRQFRDSDCDMIVAIGGGSVMDVGKCIKLYCKMDPSVNYLQQEMRDSGIPLIAIPTTAGSGSESTMHAVIYYKGEKQSISHPSLVPEAAVLEPAFLQSLPLYQKKSTLLDALCQAIESWWSLRSTEESREYSQRAIRLIRDYSWAYLLYSSPLACEKIMEAANLAGRAINITATTAAHAMSYKLTSLYGIAHGHAVALCMTQVWKNLLSYPDRCADPAEGERIRQLLSELPVSYDWFMDTLDKLSIPWPIPQNGKGDVDKLSMPLPVAQNREAEIARMVAAVNPQRMKNHPVPLEAESLKAMYEQIVK